MFTPFLQNKKQGYLFACLRVGWFTIKFYLYRLQKEK